MLGVPRMPAPKRLVTLEEEEEEEEEELRGGDTEQFLQELSGSCIHVSHISTKQIITIHTVDVKKTCTKIIVLNFLPLFT